MKYLFFCFHTIADTGYDIPSMTRYTNNLFSVNFKKTYMAYNLLLMVHENNITGYWIKFISWHMIFMEHGKLLLVTTHRY
jgi:hypothetical protein